jgi:hypothetical protein
MSLPENYFWQSEQEEPLERISFNTENSGINFDQV